MVILSPQTAILSGQTFSGRPAVLFFHFHLIARKRTGASLEVNRPRRNKPWLPRYATNQRISSCSSAFPLVWGIFYVTPGCSFDLVRHQTTTGSVVTSPLRRFQAIDSQRSSSPDAGKFSTRTNIDVRLVEKPSSTFPCCCLLILNTLRAAATNQRQQASSNIHASTPLPIVGSSANRRATPLALPEIKAKRCSD